MRIVWEAGGVCSQGKYRNGGIVEARLLEQDHNGNV